jgi:hypothetical protein
MCDKELRDDLNMGACMCGKYTVLCQDCATWNEDEGEWFCGEGACIINQDKSDEGDKGDEVSPLSSPLFSF